MLDGQDYSRAWLTLVGVLSILPDNFFTRAHLVTDKPASPRLSDKIITHQADIAYGSRERYSKFCVFDLPKLVTEDHFMIIHTDGFPVNPHKWSDQFLHYDYIGAPWPSNMCPKPVGNGGFCIRSKRFALWCAEQGELTHENEDVHICQHLHDKAVAAGFRFAPIEIAAGFSLEIAVPEFPRTIDDVFGFHGWQYHGQCLIRNPMDDVEGRSGLSSPA